MGGLLGWYLNSLQKEQDRNIERQRIAQQSEYQQGELKARQAALDEEIKQHTISNLAAQKMLEANLAQHKLENIKVMQEFGNNPDLVRQTPGETKIGETQPDANGYVYEQHQIPGLQDEKGNPLTITIPSHATSLKMLTEIAKAKDQPAHENRMEEIGKEQEGALNLESSKQVGQRNIQDSEDARSARIVEAENQRKKDEIASQNWRTTQETSSAEKRARITAGLEGGAEVDSQAAPYVQQVLNGQLSDKGLNSLKLMKGPHNAVLKGISDAGGMLPTDQEIGAVQKYQPMTNLINAIDQYNQILSRNPWESRIPGTDAWKARKNQEASIDLLTPPLARTLATETGRLSNQQIQKAEGISEPSANWLNADPISNAKKRDELLSIANDGLTANLSRLPTGQAAALKAKTGLTQIPYLTIPQRVQPQQTPGTQVAPQQNPINTSQVPTGNQGQSGGTHLYFDSKGNKIQQPNGQ